MSNQSKQKDTDAIDLDSVEVRLVTRVEQDQWVRWMSDFHYLGYHGLVGESVKYVAVYEDKWVALLGWGAASLKNIHRDRWIGWSNEIQWKRLKYLSNNMRFLILPWVRKKNLASKVLSLNLKRLSWDWERRYGHPVVLVETFVDKNRFRGTCYRASGWIELGETKGYGRRSGRYYHHGKKKGLFVRCLRRDAREILSSPALVSPLIGRKDAMIININKIPRESMQDLRERLSRITDPRKPRGIRHSQQFVLLVSVCGILSGCRSYLAIAQWAKGLSKDMLEQLGCRYNLNRGKYIPPSEPTIRRTLQNIDADEVDRIIGEWLQERFGSDAIAIDGKCLKGASRSGVTEVRLFAALAHQEGVVLSQKQVDSKTNEIPFFPKLLDSIDIKGKVVTADAMHTQVNNALYIKNRKAYYLFQVKRNQPTLFQYISGLFPEKGVIWDIEQVEKGHGRIEIRRIKCYVVTKDDRRSLHFPYCHQMFCIERERINTKTGVLSIERSYYITSLRPEKADSKRLMDLSRGHWHIENKLHWVRDVTFDEDRSQIRTKSGPRVMATLRNLVIGLLRLLGIQEIAYGLREFAWDRRLSVSLIS